MVEEKDRKLKELSNSASVNAKQQTESMKRLSEENKGQKKEITSLKKEVNLLKKQLAEVLSRQQKSLDDEIEATSGGGSAKGKRGRPKLNRKKTTAAATESEGEGSDENCDVDNDENVYQLINGKSSSGADRTRGDAQQLSRKKISTTVQHLKWMMGHLIRGRKVLNFRRQKFHILSNRLVVLQ